MVSYHFEWNKLDKDKLAKALREVGNKQIYENLINRGAMKLVRDVKETTPAKTGLARRSFFMKPVGEMAVMVYNKLPYAKYLEEGTKPHDIYPKNKKALAWPGMKGGFGVQTSRSTNKMTGKALKSPVKGYVVFARHVHHPGTKALDMIKNALPGVRDYIETQCKFLLGDVWKK